MLLCLPPPLRATKHDKIPSKILTSLNLYSAFHLIHTHLSVRQSAKSPVLGEKGGFQPHPASPIHTTVVGRAGDPCVRSSKFYMDSASLCLYEMGTMGICFWGDTPIEWRNFISNTQGMYGLPCEYRWFLHFPSEKPERLWYKPISFSKLFMHKNEALPLTDMDPPKSPH